MTDDEAMPARERVGRPRRPSAPLCPQLRVAQIDWNYPIEGYCVLEARPGRVLIPSIEEYQTCCTTPRFRECRWFGSVGGTVTDQRQTG